MTTTISTLNDARESFSAVLTLAEVSRLLGVDVRTVTRACREGQIPTIGVGRRILVPREKFLSLFDPTS